MRKSRANAPTPDVAAAGYSRFCGHLQYFVRARPRAAISSRCSCRPIDETIKELRKAQRTEAVLHITCSRNRSPHSVSALLLRRQIAYTSAVGWR
jgi:hypothetical protein